MNTDNTSISGETLDFGPCAFMESYEPMKVFSSIDQRGRYAYGNQPHAAHWNLTRLAEALLPLLTEEEGSEEAAVTAAQSALSGFAGQYETARLGGLRRKLGLVMEEDEDAGLAEDLLARMAVTRADFTGTFRSLCGLTEAGELAGLAEWLGRWRERLGRETVSVEERVAAMKAANPVYIPRNHLVAQIIEVAEGGDYRPFERLLEVTSRPFEERAELQRYAAPAEAHEEVLATFCGT